MIEVTESAQAYLRSVMESEKASQLRLYISAG